MGERTAILSCGQCSPCVTFDELNAVSAGGMVSSAFGPLLASAILDSMDGVLGQAGWRYVAFVSHRSSAYMNFPGGSSTSRVL